MCSTTSTYLRDSPSRLPRPRSAYSQLYQLNQSMERVSLLEECLAIQLQKLGPSGAGPPLPSNNHYWMYDTGYLLFQGFLESNSKCFWDGSLVAAARGLEYRGYVSPGILFVTGSKCALEVVRTAWARNVLRPPPNYAITLVGDMEGCQVMKIRQAGFTPLPDAICWVILELGASGRTANVETIRKALGSAFPAMERPSAQTVYDTLADLTAYNKVYQTCQGYFVATPDSLRLVEGSNLCRPVLMSTSEAISMLHGEMATIREGSKTHQAVQTNLADVICGGNKNDKVIYPSCNLKGATVPSSRKLERRHSMKMGGSSRRLAQSLQRAGSVRMLQPESPNKKCSLFSKLFKWTKKAQHQALAATTPPVAKAPERPPQEWFNSTVLHRHSVATQTSINEEDTAVDWSGSGSGRPRRRSLSTSRLPRKLIASPTSSTCRPSSTSRPSTPSSCKTPLYSSTPKALSSCASSGYNSLPRSHKSRSKQIKEAKLPELRTTVDEAKGVVTTTITNQNSTRIYLEQHGSPVRSIITVKNGSSPIANRRETVASPPQETKLRETKRPVSMYAPDDSPPLLMDKIKFPSTETIQLEEKLILSNSKNEKNLQRNLSNISLKAGSLIDVNSPLTKTELNNAVKRPSISMNPINPINEKIIDSLSFNNILKDSQIEILKKGNKMNISEVVKSDPNDLKQKSNFPSLGDVSLRFTSIAAQNILKGVSITSIDNIADLTNLSIVDKNSTNVSFHTDLGIV